VDIEKGWEAAKLAHRVWQWRSVKGLLAPAPGSFIDRAHTALDLDALRELWREAERANELTKELLDVIERRRQELAAKQQRERKGK
jgi:hypothetical protein